MNYLGIEFGGTKLQVAAGTGEGRIHQRWRYAVAREQGGEGIRARLEKELPAILRQHPPAAVGVGFGGPVERRTGRVIQSHQLEGWRGFPLAAWLSERSGVPVTVENDANLGGLGEAACGAGRGSDPVFYVTLGSGVGGGLIREGRVFHGATPGEAEIGHVRLDRAGGILENRCSGWAVDRAIRDAVRDQPQSRLGHWAQSSPGNEARHLSRALEEQDALAWTILRETAGHLALGLSHVVHLMHPEILVLGGGLSLVGEPLRAAVEEALQPLVMEAFREGVKVALAELGEDAVPVGALVLAAQGVEFPAIQP
jgi:glucokinase